MFAQTITGSLGLCRVIARYGSTERLTAPHCVRLTALLLTLLIFAPCTYADDFDIMRDNLRTQVFLGPLDYDPTDPDVQAFINTIETNATKWQQSLQKTPTTCLWTDYPSIKGDANNTCKHLNYTLQRLHTMALAWAYPTSALYHNQALLYNITHSLDFLYGYCLNENTTLIGNFWEWRIGMPTEYAAIVSILYEQLTPAQLDHYDKAFSNFVRAFAKAGNLTFANQADVCRNLLYMGILLGRQQDITDALTMVKRAFVDETTLAQRKNAQRLMEQMIREQGDYHNYNGILKKEGLYDDGTFIQHTAIPYIGAYGTSMARFASEMQLCFAGTTSFKAPQYFYTAMPLWIDKAYMPAIYKGEMMRMFMGRSVNSAHSSHEAARDIGLYLYNASALIQDTVMRQRVINTCADWYRANTYYSSPYDGMNPIIHRPQINRLLENAQNAADEQPFAKMLAAGDRLIHQTTRFRLGLAMSSCRIGKFEGFSGNNMSGWYTGDGMTYIYTPNHREHWLSFFNYCNYYRMPGTTVDMISRTADGAGIALFDNPVNAQSHVGGLTLCGRYSAAAMSHVGAKSDLVAKKAWFCFDNEVVCLGAGITMSEQRMVETIVESRRIDVPYFIDEEQGTTRKCYQMNYTNPTYAYINEVGGYVFPQPCTLSTYIEQNKCISLFIQHGKAPNNAGYAYILLPQLSREQVSNYAAHIPVTILRNDTFAQAVRHDDLDITAVNFWQTASVNGVNADGPSILMFRHVADSFYLSAADPTWKRNTMRFVINGKYTLVSTNKQNVNVTTDDSKTTIDIDCTDMMGQSTEMVFKTEQRMSYLDLPATDRTPATKLVRDGHIVICRDGKQYNVLGTKL